MRGSWRLLYKSQAVFTSPRQCLQVHLLRIGGRVFRSASSGAPFRSGEGCLPFEILSLYKADFLASLLSHKKPVFNALFMWHLLILEKPVFDAVYREKHPITKP